jgi:hypothetical protein
MVLINNIAGKGMYLRLVSIGKIEMMNPRIFLTVALLFISTLGFSQKVISGKIIDRAPSKTKKAQ